MPKEPKVITVKDGDDLPPGLLPDGMSLDEAEAGLFDALGSDDDELFEEAEELEQSTPEVDEDVDDEEVDEDRDDVDDDEDPDDLDDVDDKEDLDDGSDADDVDDDSDDGNLIEVTLPGGEKITVTPKEAAAGYSRTEDYTRKRQRDVADHADAMSEVREIRSQYAERLQKLKETLTGMGPAAPDAELRKSNPGEYAAQVAEHQAFQDTLERVGSAQDAISEEAQTERDEAVQAHVLLEWDKVVESVPEWGEQEVATVALAELRQFAIDELGFEATEIDSLVDSRLLLMLKQNFELTQKGKKGKKKVEAKKKAARKRLGPGSARTPKKRSAKRRKRQKSADQLAATTGSVRDAARAIELTLGDDLD